MNGFEDCVKDFAPHHCVSAGLNAQLRKA